jgi:hypothetical protein
MSKVSLDQAKIHPETLELINTEVTASLTRQFDAARNIDTKAIVLVGYAGAAAAFLATRHPQAILAAFAYAAYALAAAFGIWSYAVRGHHNVPDPRELFNGYWTRPKAETLAVLAATRVKAFESNVEEHRRKATRWWFSLATLAIGVTLMVLSLTSTYW